MQDVTVDMHNAFRVNSIGLNNAPFPLSISASQTCGVWRVDATAACAADLIDVLADGAHENAAVLNIGQNSWLNDDYSEWPLSRIAREQRVAAAAYDVSWANWSTTVAREMLVIAWRDLPRFLDGWSPYDIDIVDLPGPLEDPDELVLHINTAEAPLLRGVPGSSIYFSGHDDCYICVETTDSELPSRLLTRLLSLLAGSVLLDGAADDTVVVPTPGVELAAALLAHSSHWIGTVLDYRPGETVTIALTATAARWSLAQPVPQDHSHQVTFEVDTRTWRVDSRPASL